MAETWRIQGRGEVQRQTQLPAADQPRRQDSLRRGRDAKIVGAEHVDAAVEPTLGSDDLAFMLQHKPGCSVFSGHGDGGHRDLGHGLGPCNLHNPSYDFNDDLLPIGATYWTELAQAALPVA